MIADAEKFYLKCITELDVDTFNELCFTDEKYLEFDIERFLPTSDNIRQHIWLQSVFWKTFTRIHSSMVID